MSLFLTFDIAFGAALIVCYFLAAIHYGRKVTK